MLKLTRNERKRDRGREGKEGRKGSLRKEVVINVEFAKNKCNTTMSANWATLNRCISMVQTVLYSGCTETTVAAACNVYMHTIRYM
jgi:hypothetical protein